MQRPSLSRTAFLASQASEWLVLLFLLAASTPAILFHHGILTVVPKLNLLDDSWLLDASYKASRGVWFGRDVAFTYGPLFQWLSSVPSRWLGMSMGTTLATWYTLPLYVVVLATFLTARLLLPKVGGWRRAVLVFLAVVFWSAADVRASLCLLAFAVFLRLVDSVAAGKSSIAAGAFVAAAVCVTMFLVAADSGIYAVAALLLCLVFTSIARARISRLAQLLVVSVVGFIALAVAVNAVLASPLNFRFWRSSLAIAAGYRWFEPIAMSKLDKHHLFAILAGGVAVFAYAWLLRKPRGPWTRRPAFLVAGFGFALLMTQSSLVRSDHVHVLMGSYAMIFLGGAILLDEADGPSWIATTLAIIIIVATAILAKPVPVLLPGNVAAQLRQIARPAFSCPPGTQEFDRACFLADDVQLLRSVSGFVDSHAAPNSPIAIFPYQTVFGIASRRDVANGVLQSYLVNGGFLSGLEIAALERTRPGTGVYLPDHLLSQVLDGVPNFTRSPDVWFCYFRHYRAAGNPAPGVLGLSRDDSRDSRIQFVSQVVGTAPATVRISRRSTALDLGALRWPSDGADFLKLRLRVDYPGWWRLRKPSCLTLVMSFADGSRKPIQLVLPPGHVTDIWVYPWDDSGMATYFATDEADWRPRNRPALTGLQLLITPFDWISVVPNRLTVESVEAVRVSLS
jgi:hypothetical protein